VRKESLVKRKRDKKSEERTVVVKGMERGRCSKSRINCDPRKDFCILKRLNFWICSRDSEIMKTFRKYLKN